MGKFMRHLKTIIWKNYLLKRSHWMGFAAELLLPVLFMSLLILIKTITSIYDSPNVAYYCGNVWPWHYSETMPFSGNDIPIPFDCTQKPDVCIADNYYKDGYSIYLPSGNLLTGYTQQGKFGFVFYLKWKLEFDYDRIYAIFFYEWIFF